MKFNWKIVNALYKDYGLVQHHLESYAHLIQTIIPEIVTDTPIYSFENEKTFFFFKFLRVFIEKPIVVEADGNVTLLYPNDARLRGITYGSHVFVDIALRFKDKDTGEIVDSTETVCFGVLPVMVRSTLCRLHKAPEEELYRHQECIYDHGGYFIVKGSEKILMGMERRNVNQVFVYSSKDSDTQAKLTSVDEKAKRSPSMTTLGIFTNSLGGKSIKMSFSYFPKKNIPVGILLLALTGRKDPIKGFPIPNDKISEHDLGYVLEGIYEEIYNCETQEDAFDYLLGLSVLKLKDEKKDLFIKSILQRDFLPHVSTAENCFQEKADYIVYMILKLLKVHYGLVEPDDHDHCKNKRTDESGILIGNLFRQSWGKITRELILTIRKKMETCNTFSMVKVCCGLSFTKDIQKAIATGTWAVVRSANTKKGVSQTLSRFNLQAALSYCRRVMNPMAKNSVLTKPRNVHNSSFGFICCCESPDGATIGLVKNKAMGCMISIPFPDILIQKIISDMDFEKGEYIVVLNGKLIKNTTIDFYWKMKELKRNGSIPRDVGISIHDNEIIIQSDGGRTCRPVLTKYGRDLLFSEENKKGDSELRTWNDYILDGIIEIIDSSEQENLLIGEFCDVEDCKHRVYSHYEIDPSLMVGVPVSTIAFADSNPSARLAYQSGMCKQALSLIGMNYHYRFDTTGYILHYPQVPLCQTKTSVNYNDLPQGINSILAIASYGGYNQEDAVIVSKSFIELGGFTCSHLRTQKETTKVGEWFGKPEEQEFYKLGADGMPDIGEEIKTGDMIFGKLQMVRKEDKNIIVKKDGSLIRCQDDEGRVDSIILTSNPDGTTTCKMKIRQHLVLEVGDKLAAVPSQKGVLSQKMAKEDMPFSDSGITPDVIINPAAIPSRMTIGLLKEMIYGKNASLQGEFADGTIFNGKDPEEIYKAVNKLGYQYYGTEELMSGITGEYFKAKIYMGVVNYQRLKHMVRYKIQARGVKGPMNNYVRQPQQGKSNAGGGRIGELERDNYISLGVSDILQQRLMYQSDAFNCPICEKCGLIATANTKKNLFCCKACGSREICYVVLPYSTKLLIQDMYALHVALRIKV